MNFLQRIMLSVVVAGAFGSAQADTVNLTDGIFTAIDPVGSGEPVVFTETVGSVTLTFAAIDNLLGTNSRFTDISTAGIGLRVGGANESVTEFTLETTTSVTLDSYSTVSSGFVVFAPTFAVTGGSVNSPGNILSDADNSANAFVDGPLLLDAGTLYTFAIESPSGAAQAFIGGFEFTAVIPLPAPALLLTSGLIGVLGLRRNSRI